jgi:NAD-dependent deacetylase sirtuin 5
MAHKVIALLSSNKEALKKIAQNAESIHLITQNVDNLSNRALKLYQSGHDSTSLPIEMHGNLFRVKCSSKACGHAETNTDSPITEALRGTEEVFDQGEMDSSIQPEQLPRCSQCKRLVRPGVTWFGEPIEHTPEIDRGVKKCDLLLVSRTSSRVSVSVSSVSYRPIIHQVGVPSFRNLLHD